MTLHDFRQLRELELVVTWPSFPYEGLISSIASTELRKIIFRVTYRVYLGGFESYGKYWAPIDGQLCGLVGQLCVMGYRHTLEVELQLTKVEDHPGYCDFTRFLPEFREKGVVTIIDAAHGDRLLHSSIHNR